VGHIGHVAGEVRDRLASEGRTVTRIEIPPPGRHPHADQMDTFLFLLGAFSILACLLSAVLVANTIHALLIRQVRQIGMMKAVGATASQVAALYLGQVAVLAGASLLIGVPLGLWAGRGYAAFCASVLNANLSRVSVPIWVFAVQIAAGLAVPLAAALWPVRRASRITIHEALGDDVARRPYGTRAFDRRLARIRWLPRPLMLSLRTAFHRTGRLALTVGTLAAGGAMFISALNVSAAWSNLIEEESRAHRYDVDVRLDGPAPAAELRSLVAALPGVDRVELWSEGAGLVPDTRGGGVGGERVRLVGPEDGSTILHLPVLQGRWLQAGERDVAVVTHTLLARRPELRVGDALDLRVEGRSVSWRIVGVVKELIPIPMVYAPRDSVSEAVREDAGTSHNLRVVTVRHDSASQLSAQKDIERALGGAGIAVADIQRLLDRRKAFEDHLVIIESALILAATLVVLVGGLALTSTLMVEVFERTREIGILGAIGARPWTISLHVVAEGVLIGLMSWLAALLVAVPVTAALDAVAGRIFHRLPLDMVYSPRAAATWLALVVVLAALSSFYPARRAAGLNVREALAHA
jgi:putative ABC transport system permease protein